MTSFRLFPASVVLIAVTVITGCSTNKETPNPTSQSSPAKSGSTVTDDVTAMRAKLDPADKALVEAQEWCVISSDERLGTMGVPIKLDIKGQPVFVCCKGCVKKAEADPDKTLAKVVELKAKKAAEKLPH